MKTFFLKTFFGIGSLVLIIGCQASQKANSPIYPAQNPFSKSLIDQRPLNSYYYFTEAQIKINSGDYEKAALLTRKAIEMA